MPIVAAIDESERASIVLDEGRRLASAFDTDLHAVHVLERSELVSVLRKDVEGQDLTENHEVRQVAEKVVANAGGDEAVTVEVRVGDAAEEISAYAAAVDANYVVVGGRQRSPTGKALFGSVTQQVMFESPVPVVNVALED